MARRIFHSPSTHYGMGRGIGGPHGGGGHYYIKESEYISEIAAKDQEILMLKSDIRAKDSEIRNLKSEMNANEDVTGQLYDEKEFVDVKIICNGKKFACHKAVLGCQSKVFKTMIRNKSLTEKQAAVMEIEEKDFNSETMEQVLFYFYHGKVQDTKMINTDLLRAADKYETIGLMDMCAKYLESNLSLENALDVLVTAELTSQIGLFGRAHWIKTPNNESCSPNFSTNFSQFEQMERKKLLNGP